jgi:hypothetical protein
MKESEMSITKPPDPAQFRQQMLEMVEPVVRPESSRVNFGPHVTSILI